MITPGVTPPDIDLFDMDEHDHARNRAYCRELEAQMLAAELDPRNFFRHKAGRHGTSGYPSVRPGRARALL